MVQCAADLQVGPQKHNRQGRALGTRDAGDPFLSAPFHNRATAHHAAAAEVLYAGKQLEHLRKRPRPQLQELHHACKCLEWTQHQVIGAAIRELPALWPAPGRRLLAAHPKNLASLSDVSILLHTATQLR